MIDYHDGKSQKHVTCIQHTLTTAGTILLCSDPEADDDDEVSSLRSMDSSLDSVLSSPDHVCNFPKSVRHGTGMVIRAFRSAHVQNLRIMIPITVCWCVPWE